MINDIARLWQEAAGQDKENPFQLGILPQQGVDQCWPQNKGTCQTYFQKANIDYKTKAFVKHASNIITYSKSVGWLLFSTFSTNLFWQEIQNDWRSQRQKDPAQMEAVSQARKLQVMQTSQELRMLSTVTLDCQVTKIVMNSGSQL